MKKLVIFHFITLLCFNIISTNCAVEKRDVHRIILREEIYRPKRHHPHQHPKKHHYHHKNHGYDQSLENLSFRESGENSYENDANYEAIHKPFAIPSSAQKYRNRRQKPQWNPVDLDPPQTSSFSIHQTFRRPRKEVKTKKLPEVFDNTYKTFSSNNDFSDFKLDQKNVHFIPLPTNNDVGLFKPPENFERFYINNTYQVHEEETDDDDKNKYFVLVRRGKKQKFLDEHDHGDFSRESSGKQRNIHQRRKKIKEF